jgi:hypothetical protein
LAGCCECGDEPSGSGATELDRILQVSVRGLDLLATGSVRWWTGSPAQDKAQCRTAASTARNTALPLKLRQKLTSCENVKPLGDSGPWSW